MIPIKINGKKHSIKPISKLTTAEFIDMSKIKDMNYVKYIAWQVGITEDEAFFAVVSNSVQKAIGNLPDISKLKLPKWPDYSKLIETVGQRHQIEQSGLIGYELLVFVLAVSQAHSSDITKVHELRDSYLTKPYSEILPAGFFFLKILQNGRKPGCVFLVKLKLMTNIILKKLRLV